MDQPKIRFEYGGIFYDVDLEASFADTDIVMPDGVHVRADNWTKSIPLAPCNLHVVAAGQEASRSVTATQVPYTSCICSAFNPECDALGCRSSADLREQSTYPHVKLADG